MSKSSEEASLERYQAAKQLFLKLVNETDAKCHKGYVDRYDQERNISIAVHPEIEPLWYVRVASLEKVLGKLEKIEEKFDSPNRRLIKLCQYVAGITDLRFSGLFMVIFCGKLRSHFLTSPVYADAQKLFAGSGISGNVTTVLSADVPALVEPPLIDVASNPSESRGEQRVSTPSQ